jgi:pimeloyl-ACP methyl ester carboxylesterase
MLLCLAFFRAARPTPEFSTFPQLLDHFNLSISARFNQTFAVDRAFADGGRTLVLEVSDLRPLNRSAPFSATAIAIARRSNATLASLELRGFGASRLPGPAFLSLAQVLSDHSAFVAGIAADRTLAVGGGYGGTIAAWLRQKFPHAVAAAVASSAPLEARVGIPLYWERTARRLDRVAPGCNGTVGELFAGLENNSTLALSGLPDAASARFVASEAIALMVAASDQTDFLPRLCAVDPAPPMPAFLSLLNETLGHFGYLAADFVPNRTSIHPDQLSVWRLRCAELGGFREVPPWVDLEFYAECCDDLAGVSDCAAAVPLTNAHFLPPQFHPDGRPLRLPGGDTMLLSYPQDDPGAELMAEAEDRALEIFLASPVAHGAPAADLRAPAPGEDDGLPASREQIIATAVDWLTNKCNRTCGHGNCVGHTCVCHAGFNGEFCNEIEFTMLKNKFLASWIVAAPTVLLLVGAVVAWLTILKEPVPFSPASLPSMSAQGAGSWS